MSKPAFTLKAFGIYLLIFGAGLALIPNLLLPLFGFPQTTEVWIRVVGVLALLIGVYYWYAAKSEATAIIRVSVYTRTLVLVSFAAFVVLGYAQPILILFGVIDFAGGVWTYLALRAEH